MWPPMGVNFPYWVSWSGYSNMRSDQSVPLIGNEMNHIVMKGSEKPMPLPATQALLIRHISLGKCDFGLSTKNYETDHIETCCSLTSRLLHHRTMRNVVTSVWFHWTLMHWQTQGRKDYCWSLRVHSTGVVIKLWPTPCSSFCLCYRRDSCIKN